MFLKTVKQTMNFIRDEFTYQEWTYAGFAEAYDVCAGTVSRLVNGKTTSPHFKTILVFIKGLGFGAEIVDKAAVKAETKKKKRKTAKAA